MQLSSKASESLDVSGNSDLKPDPEKVVDASIQSIKQPGHVATPALVASAAHQGFGSCCTTRNATVLPKLAANTESQAVSDDLSNEKNATLKRALPYGISALPKSAIHPDENSVVFDRSAFTMVDGRPTNFPPPMKRRRSSMDSFRAPIRQGGCCSSSHTHQAIVQTAPLISKHPQNINGANETQQANGYQFPVGSSIFPLPSQTTQGDNQYHPLITVQSLSMEPSSSLVSTMATIGSNGLGAHHLNSNTTQLGSDDTGYTTTWTDQAIHYPLLDSDVCRCGDACECFACPVHPFNTTTRNEIQELSAILEEDQATEYAAQTLPTPNNELSEEVDVTQDFMLGDAFCFGPDLPFAQATSDHAIQGGTTIIPDYNTLQYMYQHCEGQGNTCQCQDDCACPSCPTHAISPLPEGYEGSRMPRPSLLMSASNSAATVHSDFPQVGLGGISNNGQQRYYQYQYHFNSAYLDGPQYPDTSITQDQILASATTPLTNSD